MPTQTPPTDDELWAKSARELAQMVGDITHWTEYHRGRARVLLEAKTIVAMEATARWTKWLVFATFALAVVSVVLTVAGAS
jgi:hypothetical protein